MSNKRARSDGRVLQRGLPGKGGAPKGARRSHGPSPRKVPPSAPPDRHEELFARLRTAEDTLRAIQSGDGDALVVSGRWREQVVALKGGDPAYRILVGGLRE